MTPPDAPTLEKRFPVPLARLGGDPEIFIELAQVVLEDAPPELQSLRNLLKQQRFPEAASTAHRAKGMLSTFDNDVVSPKMQRLIDAAHAEDADAVAQTADEALPAADQLIDRLRRAVEGES